MEFLMSGSHRRRHGESTIGKRIGARIRELRLQQTQQTQEDLARSIGISVSYLSVIERGLRVPAMHTLGAIAHALDVPVTALLSGPEPSDSQDPGLAVMRRISAFIQRHQLKGQDVDRLLRVAHLMFDSDKP
jgi:transcriptional regulator with XRE-family HTH domain